MSTATLGFLGNLGPTEILIVLLIILLLFGASRLPALFRSLGQGLSEFKKGIQEGGKDQPAAAEPPKEQK